MPSVTNNAKVGNKAPAFSVLDDQDRRVSLKDFEGRPVVLFFYPKDDTTGCTKEACSFRDALPRFDKMNATILGISPDSTKSHRKFKEKYDLPYTLLADEDHKVAEQYGVWGEKSMYGRKYLGILRTTFVIDAKGKIAKVFEKVKPEEHATEVAEAVAALNLP
jgi:peroxiredoxin Q/BCP